MNLFLQIQNPNFLIKLKKVDNYLFNRLIDSLDIISTNVQLKR